MEASEPKWVDSNYIWYGVNSLRLRDFQLYQEYVFMLYAKGLLVGFCSGKSKYFLFFFQCINHIIS